MPPDPERSVSNPPASVQTPAVSKSRIEARFRDLSERGDKGLVIYLTAGDPSLDATGELIGAIDRAGADVIELGVPFSDPMADGPVIQRASERALKHGFGIGDLLETVASVRRTIETPIILFTYFNPILQFGVTRLAEEAKAAGVDGLLVTDLSPEEAGDFESELRAHDLDMFFLVAPT